MKIELWKKIEILKCNKCYFKREPKIQNAFWIKPEISCEIKFLEWTLEGHIRHSIFEKII